MKDSSKCYCMLVWQVRTARCFRRCLHRNSGKCVQEKLADVHFLGTAKEKSTIWRNALFEVHSTTQVTGGPNVHPMTAGKNVSTRTISVWFYCIFTLYRRFTSETFFETAAFAIMVQNKGTAIFHVRVFLLHFTLALVRKISGAATGIMPSPQLPTQQIF